MLNYYSKDTFLIFIWIMIITNYKKKIKSSSMNTYQLIIYYMYIWQCRYITSVCLYSHKNVNLYKAVRSRDEDKCPSLSSLH